MSDSAAPKRFIVSWDQFHRDSRALAWRLVEKRDEWKGIIAITRGGMIPAGIVARELEIKLIETIGISSYDDKVQRQTKVIKNINEKVVGSGEGWLFHVTPPGLRSFHAEPSGKSSYVLACVGAWWTRSLRTADRISMPVPIWLRSNLRRDRAFLSGFAVSDDRTAITPSLPEFWPGWSS